MKIFKIAAISSALILSSAYSFAGSNELSEEHSKHHPATTEKQSSKEVSSATNNAIPVKGDIKEDLEKMKVVMEKIHQEKSPDARRKLMQEHMAMMQEGMTCMGGMDNMQQHMDMMQQMMDQMMQHMAAME